MVSHSTRFRFLHLRPMDFGEILDNTVQVMKAKWKPMLAAGLISMLPMVVYAGLANMLMPARVTSSSSTSWFMQAVLRAETGDFSELLQLSGMFLLLLLVSALLGLWLHGAMVVMASRTYLGLPVTFGTSLKMAGRRYPALLGTGLLMVLLAILAVIGLAIAGLVFFAMVTIPIGLAVLKVYTVFVSQALIIEEADGGMAPITRSFRLVNGRFWPLLGLGIIFSLFAGALSSQFQFITQLPLQWLMTFGVNPAALPILGWLLAIVTGLVSAVISPLTYTAITLAYYDTRMRKEGLDLELMATAGAEMR